MKTTTTKKYFITIYEAIKKIKYLKKEDKYK